MKLMKITRTIRGEEIDIELTFEEMVKAREQIEIEFLREDIVDMVGDLDPDLLDAMAEEARDYVIYSDMSLTEARDTAIENYIYHQE